MHPARQRASRRRADAQTIPLTHTWHAPLRVGVDQPFCCPLFTNHCSLITAHSPSFARCASYEGPFFVRLRLREGERRTVSHPATPVQPLDTQVTEIGNGLVVQRCRGATDRKNHISERVQCTFHTCCQG